VTLPRLHVVTNDAVVARDSFADEAAALLSALGQDVALHLRAHATPGGHLFRVAEALAGVADAAGATLLVNDRVDVALAAGCGAQVGRRSLSVAAVRRLLGSTALVGYSAHERDEARAAARDGANFVLLGTIWPSASHPGEPARGLDLVRDTVAAASGPVVVIGGVTADRAREAAEAGAHGVAVVTGVWDAGDPVEAARRYLGSMVEAR
jgi:thiamine-phosphate pyrophosphorylase